jgi:FkbM family methyltransferase
MLREQLIRLVGHNRVWLLFKTRVWPDRRNLGVSLWLLDNPREEARYAYPLSSDSVVLDVGGYRGEWSAEIVRRYDPFVHIFEPIPEFAAELAVRFASNPKVTVHAFGLGDTDGLQLMAEIGDASSAYVADAQPTSVAFRDVTGVVRDMDLRQIDLVKMNIEGGEYPLLRRMIDAGIVARCRDIQVQFHDFVPDAERQYAEIRTRLVETHSPTYEYRFVWENWRRRD